MNCRNQDNEQLDIFPLCFTRASDKTIMVPTTCATTPILSSNTNINNNVNLLTALNNISNSINMSHLKQIHAQALRATVPDNPNTLFLHSKILQFSSLLDIDYASKLFDNIRSPNCFMWNTLIRGFAKTRDDKQKQHAIFLFRRMLEDGDVMPDKYTFPFVLKACAYLFALSEGRQVHGQVLKRGLQSDVYVCNSLVHLYASCGCLDLAKKVFEKMPERSLVSWNVMIDALVGFGEFELALGMFGEMQRLFEPDGFTMQSVVAACAGLGALSLGMWAHAFVLRRCDGNVGRDVLVNNSLLDMYCKCGALGIARQLFERMPEHDLNSWNSMILGYAIHGQADAVLDYFERLISTERLVPNSVTFVGVLNACSHSGMVDDGRKYFSMMVSDYKIEPRLEHYGCLVDLLARAGLINDALSVVSSMPMRPDVVIWRSLLDACCKKKAGVELSEEMARLVLDSEEGVSSGVYVLLSRIYASANRWDDVGLVRKLMADKGVKKEPGCSTIEIDGTAHEFFAGDTTHPQTNDIYKVLDMIEERLENVGYSPDFSQAPMVDEIEDGKQQSLRVHSERLAIALGLLYSKPGVPIRVFKNLRVCNDCHEVTKHISKMFNVEIIVRDRARFHHFKDGSCSCRDYW